MIKKLLMASTFAISPALAIAAEVADDPEPAPHSEKHR
jgi:hypothetical protein